MITRYLFVTGGVMSGIGKGIAVSSIARILKDRGLRVAPVKIDPYINVDAGTMNPLEHGEVFVTEDGMECDQDLGNYERFLDESLTGHHSITTGQIYQTVITRERNLGYGGRCVEVVPDIPNEVIRRLREVARRRRADVVIVEVGGTAGEYQNILFLEAARLMRRGNPRHVAVALVSYLPIPHAVGEMKTKPTQQAVRALQSAGLQPDFIIARGAQSLDAPRKRKLALFCNVDEARIISAPDAEYIYRVPELFERERLGDRLLETLHISSRRYRRPSGGIAAPWRRLLRRIDRAHGELRIALIGKYFATGSFVLSDAYLSVIEALKHGAWAVGRRPVLVWIDAEQLERDTRALAVLGKFHGLLVPGGFGGRGVEGKLRAIRFAREHRIPFLGLCYGMQLSVVEFARNVCGLSGAHTTEVNPKTRHPVIDILPEQERLLRERVLGGSMRLGLFRCALRPSSVAARAYKARETQERHRHRYELNNAYREILERKGMRMSGVNPDRDLVEIAELPGHPFFVGTQFHPELQSRPLHPHPLFVAFAKAAARRKR
ncbi:MAG: CTP synthase [Candidatus Terrybacteria bacterium RIFCSPHIGHO2_01_FULL_58_15]|uniref:CTP synthase n=1 Tax=Terrybacteria sp. (strain RIFCSPHIGHO2_01_FULL_58_15) TaxID=1802363 RepID=A0A1G2PLT9_TERXR|nr:MAG: CTP synthase [Candidatus Terrybacteria bacterium RIFCSPHIGHO2_01_FULL_58_15]